MMNHPGKGHRLVFKYFPKESVHERYLPFIDHLFLYFLLILSHLKTLLFL